MSGTKANLEDLDGLAAKLRAGAARLDGSATPPPAPQAGVPTEAIAGVMAMLTMSTAGIVEGLNAVADEVAAGRNVYDETDENNAGEFLKNSPFRPR